MSSGPLMSTTVVSQQVGQRPSSTAGHLYDPIQPPPTEATVPRKHRKMTNSHHDVTSPR